jgi:hypothetical protein
MSCKRLINPITNPNPISVTNTCDNINSPAVENVSKEALNASVKSNGRIFD